MFDVKCDLDGHMKRRDAFPMPVASLFNHPEFIALPSSGRGMLITLLLHYWLSDCSPMPTSNARLFGIAHAHPPVWKEYQPVIMRIFYELKPELDAYFEYRKAKKSLIREIGAGAAARARAKRLKENAPATLDPAEAIPLLDRTKVERPLTMDERGNRARLAPGKRG